MNKLRRLQFFLKLFSWFKVPMIAYTRPKIVLLTEEEIVIRIALKRRTKNHLNSMYFGTLAVGADVAGGLPAFYLADQLGCKLSMVFKSFQADFLKRPMSDVFFVAKNNEAIKSAIEKAEATKERVNQEIDIEACTYYYQAEQRETVARFKLEISIKVISAEDVLRF